MNKWSWQYPDGTKDTSINSNKLFLQSGSFNIKHTSINDIGCATDTIKTVTIAPQPVAAFNFSNPTCDGSPVKFTDASTIALGKIVKWYWDFGNGQKITNTSNADVTSTFTTGNFTVSLQVENETGCKSAITRQTITVHASPIISFDMPGACLPAGKAVFTNLSTINDGSAGSLTYSWNFGDGGTSTDKNPQHNYTTAGPFSVNLKATTGFGCSKNSTKVFSNIYPQPVAAFNLSPTKICNSDSVHFIDASTAQNSSVTEWNWRFGDGRISSIPSPTNKYSDSGYYTVSLYVKSEKGCTSDTARKTIYINKSPTASFSISSSTCQNEAFTITDKSKANSGTINSWSWHFGDGTTESRTNGDPFTKTSAAAGNYAISLVVVTNNGCKSDTAKQTAAVRLLPVANFILPKVFLNDPFASFKDSSYLPGSSQVTFFTYKWNFGDPNASAVNPDSSTQQNPQHKYAAAGISAKSIKRNSKHWMLRNRHETFYCQ